MLKQIIQKIMNKNLSSKNRGVLVSLFGFFFLLAGNVNAWGQRTYDLVTSNSQLEAGSKYLIVATTSSSATNVYALGPQATNNRTGVVVGSTAAAAVPSQVITTPASISVPSGAYEITLGGSIDAWTLNDEVNGTILGPYTSGTTNTNNYLHSNSGATFTINIETNNAANMTCVTSTNFSGRNTIMFNYNSGSPLFACYTGGQTVIYLYKKECISSVSFVNEGEPYATPKIQSACGEAITLPANPTSACATDGWVFAGWKVGDDNYADAPTIPATETTYIPDDNVTLYAVYSKIESGGSATITYGWESSEPNASSWDTPTLLSGNTAITAHGGSSYGANVNASGNGVAGNGCFIKTKDKILPTNLIFYYSKTSSNTTSQDWIVQKSTNGSTWTTVTGGTFSASGATNGVWSKASVSFNEDEACYIRITMSTTNTAIRTIDDVSLTYDRESFTTYSSVPCTLIFDANNAGYDGYTAVGNWTLVSSALQNSTKNDFTFGANSAAFKGMVAPDPETGGNYKWATLSDSNLDPGMGFAYQVNPAIANNDNPSWALYNGQRWFDNSRTNDDNSITVSIGDKNLKYALVGNPYYSDIDMGHFDGDNLLTDGYYTTTADGNTFPLVAEDLTISKWQGIIVSTSADAQEQGLKLGDITIYKNLEDVPSLAPALVPAIPNGKMKVTASTNAGSSSTYINNKSTGTSIVGNHDMSFLNMGENQTVQVYTQKDNSSGSAVRLALNTINDDVTQVPLGIFTTYNGNADLTFSGMDTYSCDITLLDHLTGAEIDLTGLPSYNYQIGITGSADSRFELDFGQRVPTSNPTDNVNIQAFVRDGKIVVVTSDDLQNLKIYSVSGSQIANLNVSGKSYIVNEQLPAGIYLVTIQTTRKISTQKIVLKNY